jgi:hypothetical protein
MNFYAIYKNGSFSLLLALPQGVSALVTQKQAQKSLGFGPGSSFASLQFASIQAVGPSVQAALFALRFLIRLRQIQPRLVHRALRIVVGLHRLAIFIHRAVPLPRHIEYLA